MGDMADDALDQMMDIDEIQQNLRGLGFDELTDWEREQIYDYDGSMMPSVFSKGHTIPKARGPGACPQCGADTIIKKGPYGEFYGCSKFPKCRGNRDK